MSTQKMNAGELRTTLALASILALRMLGLFMLLPVFSVFALHLTGATPMLIGVALGIYGLTQGLLQIPFGMLSDIFGRKIIICVGLVVFSLGSIVAALSHSIDGVLIGRALQGAGAIGSATMAMVADVTRVQQRTKAMAIAGITIGVSFSLAMVLGPLLVPWIGGSGIFWLAAVFGGFALLILYLLVPAAPTVPKLHPKKLSLWRLLKNPELMRFNLGIFLQHAVFTATFVVLPISLQHAGLISQRQWLVFFPSLLIAFIMTMALIILVEKKHWLKPFFLGAIVAMALAEYLFWCFAQNLLLSAAVLLLYFTAFSLLEAFLPSLISRAAPPSSKGTALGIYSTSQFFGIFFGGGIGGWLYGTYGLIEVYLLGAALTLLWLVIAFGMKKECADIMHE